MIVRILSLTTVLCCMAPFRIPPPIHNFIILCGCKYDLLYFTYKTPHIELLQYITHCQSFQNIFSNFILRITLKIIEKMIIHILQTNYLQRVQKTEQTYSIVLNPDLNSHPSDHKTCAASTLDYGNDAVVTYTQTQIEVFLETIQSKLSFYR